ncbi:MULTISPECIES: hypothetical protein [Thalassospira]|uniref:Uncharacterized protein n=1 Tax=Thalassospira aquimaris TaxID=3037796 RepID=A0ABT6G8D2_9PROT|nr:MULTISPECIES: hypothetical protein [Thalassospira]MDG4718263.1 hypothetical protein [Thalassospira sp. FZY0004]
MAKRTSNGIVRSCMVAVIFVVALLLSFELLPSAQADDVATSRIELTFVPQN